jgi:type I restriction enzyme, S subunit
MARTRLYPPSVDAGFPELPSTPAGWIRTTFGDALEVVERPIKLQRAARYKLLTARRSRGGITLRSELLGREVLTKTQFRVKAGDFLISRRQIIHGACGVVPADLDDAVVSNEYSTLRTRSGLLMEFLRYYSHSSYFQRTCFHSSHGVDVEKMIFKLDEWLKRNVDLPPIFEQRKIAAILSSVDEVMERTGRVIEQLRVVKKGTMRELLTHGPPGRHTQFSPLPSEWRLGRVDSSVKQIPAAWDLVPLTTVARLESGHTPSRREHAYWEGNIPWVSLHDSKRLDVPEIHETAQTISELGLANSSARLLPAGTVVFSRTATVGKATIIGREMATSQDFANYVCGERIHNRYLMHVLRYMQGEWDRLMAGSAHKTIYMPVFRDLQVLLPPIEEQREIAAVADGIDMRLTAESSMIAGLGSVKSALMSVLLSGQLRVEAGEAAAA